MTILDEIVRSKSIELAGQMAVVSASAVKNRAAHQAPARGFAEELAGEDLAVIAEFKRRSPSAGSINIAADPTEVARAYEAAGAAAISVLTERDYFGGHLEDLVRVKQVTCLPVLRKDFIFDDYQVYESRALGADAILLIARILGREQLEHLLMEVEKAGLEALVEVRSEVEIEDALGAGARVIGINNRDLGTLDVDLSTVEGLRPCVPDDVLVVSESGCRGREDVARLRNVGVDAVLIGGALMESDDVGATMASLFGRE